MTLKTIVVALVLALLITPFVGCDSKASTSSVAGTWVIDASKSKAALRDAAKSTPGMENEKMREGFVKMMEGMIDTAAGIFHVTFNADGTFSGTEPMGRPVKGKWTLDAATSTLSATPDDGSETVVAKATGSELQVQKDGKTAMVLVKGAPKGK